MTWVKVCGTTSLQDAQLSVAAGADALGFLFAPSPRRIEVAAAAEIIAALPGGIDRIGVFVDQAPADVAAVAERVGLTGVQLHGDEAAEHQPQFRQALGERKIIKALHAGELLAADSQLAVYLAAAGVLDAILLDSGSAGQRGGTGVPFNWQTAAPLAARIRERLPLIIAGGLRADNAAEAILTFEPWGVDVVSGVEREPGKKDERKLRDFLAAVRRTPASARQRE